MQKADLKLTPTGNKVEVGNHEVCIPDEILPYERNCE